MYQWELSMGKEHFFGSSDQSSISPFFPLAVFPDPAHPEYQAFEMKKLNTTKRLATAYGDIKKNKPDDMQESFNK